MSGFDVRSSDDGGRCDLGLESPSEIIFSGLMLTASAGEDWMGRGTCELMGRGG